MTFVEGKDFVANSDAAHSRLRPEAVESLFVMYRVTQDVKYRAASWEIFSSIEKHARVDTGVRMRDVPPGGVTARAQGGTPACRT